MKHSKAEITREYGPFDGVGGVHGVSYDGKQVWFATTGGLNALDAETGQIVRTIEISAHAGTAFDGTYFYQIAETMIRKIDPETGAILASIPAPGGGGDSGLAWAEGSLWVGHHRSARIHQVDPETGKVLRIIQSDRFVTGVTWVDGELWHGTWQDDESDIRRIDPETGTVLVRLDMPEGTMVSGLESDGRDHFYCGGGPSGKLRTVRRPR